VLAVHERKERGRDAASLGHSTGLLTDRLADNPPGNNQRQTRFRLGHKFVPWNWVRCSKALQDLPLT
jgi:hypothetical protein